MAIDLGLQFDFGNIDSLKACIVHHRPLSKRLADSLHEKLIVEWTYNSNAVEGNTLTLSETKVFYTKFSAKGTVGPHDIIFVYSRHVETVVMMTYCGDKRN